MAGEEKLPVEDGKPYKIVYYRSPQHRYVSSDGVWMSLNGFGKIILNFFNDSPVLPKEIMAETTSDLKQFTSKKPEITLESDAGAIRQFEISVTMSLAAAKALHNTLTDFIKMGEDAEKTKQSTATK